MVMSLIGIDKEIYSVLEEENPNLYGYGLSEIRIDMRDFLIYDKSKEKSKTLMTRKDLAIKMTSEILAKHGKAPAFRELLEFLEKIEIGAQFFDENLRDHLVHSFNNYLLGLYFVCRSERIEAHVLPINPIVWKLASLLHDISYPVQILYKQMGEFFKKIEIFKQNNLPKKHASVISQLASLFTRKKAPKTIPLAERYFKDLEILYRGDNAFELIKRRLVKYGFNIDLQSYFYKKVNEGFVDHGILSALIVLNLIDALYAKHNPRSLGYLSKKVKEKDGSYEYINWGRDLFDRKIVDAATVISLHNLVRNPILQDYQIGLEKTPILYLLVLSDNIQVWRRHSIFREVYSPDCINISFDHKEIRCTLDIADDEKLEARDVLEDKLDDSELTIKVQ